MIELAPYQFELPDARELPPPEAPPPSRHAEFLGYQRVESEGRQLTTGCYRTELGGYTAELAATLFERTEPLAFGAAGAGIAGGSLVRESDTHGPLRHTRRLRWLDAQQQPVEAQVEYAFAAQTLWLCAATCRAQERSHCVTAFERAHFTTPLQPAPPPDLWQRAALTALDSPVAVQASVPLGALLSAGWLLCRRRRRAR